MSLTKTWGEEPEDRGSVVRAGWSRPAWPAWLIEVNLSRLCRLFAASPTLTLLSMMSARQWHESAAGRQAPGLLKHRNTSLAPYLFFPSSPPQQIEKPAGQTEFPNSRDHHVFPHTAHATSTATHTHTHIQSGVTWQVTCWPTADGKRSWRRG